MRGAWVSAVALLFLAGLPAAQAADEPVFDASIDGTVDGVDYVKRTISIVPLRPVGETFRVAGDCKVTLSRKEVVFTRLEPGHRVSLTYDRLSSVVGRIVAIPGDRLQILHAKDEYADDAAGVTSVKKKQQLRPKTETVKSSEQSAQAGN